MSNSIEKKDLLGLLIPKLWLEGYHIIYRKFGKYLQAPPPVGEYEIDLVAKKGNSFAIALCLSANEIDNPALIEKIRFLASRRSRFNKQPIQLFIGIDTNNYFRLARLLQMLDNDEKKSIKSFALSSVPAANLFQNTHEGTHTPAPYYV